MNVRIFADKNTMAGQAAQDGAALIRTAIAERGEANIIVATGASQLEMFSHLVQVEDVDWHRVTAFHLDEYVGLPVTHPGSFRLYLWRQFVSRLPVPLQAFHFLDAERDCTAECQRVGDLITKHPIDVAFIGIGENAHVAFNDPPADFNTEDPYILVTLDEACRRQQHGEGWFESLDDVPNKAITMSVRQILKSKNIVCTVPDERKAVAVRDALEGPITSDVPASILQEHPSTTLYLDQPAATLCEGLAGKAVFES